MAVLDGLDEKLLNLHSTTDPNLLIPGKRDERLWRHSFTLQIRQYRAVHPKSTKNDPVLENTHNMAAENGGRRDIIPRVAFNYPQDGMRWINTSEVDLLYKRSCMHWNTEVKKHIITPWPEIFRGNNTCVWTAECMQSAEVEDLYDDSLFVPLKMHLTANSLVLTGNADMVWPAARFANMLEWQWHLPGTTYGRKGRWWITGCTKSRVGNGVELRS